MVALTIHDVFVIVSIISRTCAAEAILVLTEGGLIQDIFKTDVVIFRIIIRPANGNLICRNLHRKVILGTDSLKTVRRIYMEKTYKKDIFYYYIHFTFQFFLI